MSLVSYDPNSTLRAARAVYFQANRFGSDGGYNAKWVEFKLGPLPFIIPNTASRVRAVAYHDLHHVITGYTTDFRGEFEISAWEIGAGCKDFYAAWFLNLGGLAAGLLCVPRRTLRAFLRGRHSRTLYGAEIESLLAMRVHEVRALSELPGSESHRVTLRDLGLLALSASAGVAAGLVFLTVGAMCAPFVLGRSLFRASTRHEWMSA